MCRERATCKFLLITNREQRVTLLCFRTGNYAHSAYGTVEFRSRFAKKLTERRGEGRQTADTRVARPRARRRVSRVPRYTYTRALTRCVSGIIPRDPLFRGRVLFFRGGFSTKLRTRRHCARISSANNPDSFQYGSDVTRAFLKSVFLSRNLNRLRRVTDNLFWTTFRVLGQPNTFP